MGMGEPLLNPDATLAALRVLMDEDGFGVPPRKLTLSTVGILPALERLAREPVRPNLAISLHAPDAALRRALMPIEKKYPIDAVIAAALAYPVPSGGLVTFEYVLLGGVNDSPGHARQLARRLGGKRAKVNLIPLNPAPEIPFQAPRPRPSTRSPRRSPRRTSRCRCVARAGGTSSPPAANSTSRRRKRRPPRYPEQRPPLLDPLRARARAADWPRSRRSSRRGSPPLRWSGPRSTSPTPHAAWSRAATGWSRATRGGRSSTSRS